MIEIHRCPNPECDHKYPMQISVVREVLHGNGTTMRWRQVLCTSCFYHGPDAQSDEEAIRLHNLISAAPDDAKQAGQRPLNLKWGRHDGRGEYHIEWHAPCGCAYHPEPKPHVHQCIKHTDLPHEAPDDGKGLITEPAHDAGHHPQYARHLPDPERVKAAHTGMTAKQLEGHYPHGHRTYYQAADEGCYICALLYEIDRLRAPQGWQQGAAREIAAEVWSRIHHLYGVGPDSLPVAWIQEQAEAILARHQEGKA